MSRRLILTVPAVTWLITLFIVINQLIVVPPALATPEAISLILFVIILIFTDTLGVPTGGGYASLSPMIALVNYLVLGTAFAGALTFIATLGVGMVRYFWGEQVGMLRPSDNKDLMGLVAANGTIQTLSIMGAGWVLDSTSSLVPLAVVDRSTIGGLFGLGLIYFTINHVLIAAYISLRGWVNFKAHLRELPLAFLYEFTPAIFSPFLAIAYVSLGWLNFVFVAMALGIFSFFAHNLDRTRQKLERRIRELDSLQAMGQSLSRSLDLDQVLAAVYQQVMTLMPASIFFIAFYDEQSDRISFPIAVDDGEQIDWAPRKVGNGLTEFVLHTKRPLLIQGDMAQIISNMQLSTFGELAKCWLGVPLIAGDRVLGVMSVQSLTHNHLYDLGHQEILETIAVQAAIAIQNAEMYQQTGSNLAQRVQELDSILGATQNGILLIDLRLQVLAENHILRHMAGIAEAETINGRFLHQWPTSSDSLLHHIGYSTEAFEEDCQQLLTKKAHHIEASFQAAQTGGLYFERKLTPVFDETESITGWLFIFRDVTEELELEALRQEMTHMLVHDLRSPLSVIKSSLDLLKGKLAPADRESVLSFIEGSNIRLLKMVDDLLDINQFESGKVPLNQEPVVVSGLFTEMAKQFAPVLTETEITLETEIAENLPFLWADVDYFSRVLHNLIDNAVKYSPDNGRIQLSAQLDPEYPNQMQLAVQDNGNGIHPDIQPLVFQKFQKDFTGRGRRKGSGLGLSFCLLAIEAHDGEIWVESSGNAGEGSRFIMRLPLNSD